MINLVNSSLKKFTTRNLFISSLYYSKPSICHNLLKFQKELFITNETNRDNNTSSTTSSQKRNFKCYSCGDFGHRSSECTKGKICYSCNETGHIARDCKNPKQGRTCHYCKKEGHLSRNCPERKEI